MLDAEIPQTAAIKRDEAQLEVEYDGAPKFEKISGTSVSYAVNTGGQVLKIDNRYYAARGVVHLVVRHRAVGRRGLHFERGNPEDSPGISRPQHHLCTYI